MIENIHFDFYPYDTRKDKVSKKLNTGSEIRALLFILDAITHLSEGYFAITFSKHEHENKVSYENPWSD